VCQQSFNKKSKESHQETRQSGPLGFYMHAVNQVSFHISKQTNWPSDVEAFADSVKIHQQAGANFNHLNEFPIC
jgi:hypothetical protein